MYSIIFGLLLIYTIQDLRYRKINVLYSLGAVLMILVVVGIQEERFLVSRFLGFLTGCLLYGFSMMTKEQIGKGDAVLLMVSGIGLGFWDNMLFFFVSLFCAAIYAMVHMFRHGMKRGMAIPFMPFMLLGFVFTWIFALR